MAFDRFLIAPFETGLQLNLRPWLIMDDAFEQLENAYVWRGKVRKRFGTKYTGTSAPSAAEIPLFSRLAVALSGGAGVGTTSKLPTPIKAAGTAPGDSFHVGQMFSISDVTFTVTHTSGSGNLLRSDNSGETATFDIDDGSYDIQINAYPETQVYFYPAEPVMGIMQYNTGDINNHPSYVFDTQFVYTYSDRWLCDDISLLFKGDDTQFFWGTNYIEETTGTKALFVTNFNATVGTGPFTHDDPIYYLAGGAWAAFEPIIIPAGSSTPEYTISQARLIINFKGRLLLLNTIEYDETTKRAYPNRCRFSSYGGNAASDNAFVEPLQTGYEGGGYIDAPTDQSIISAQFIKDRLIVYFERSTYELAYTGNQMVPFVWQKLNTELGSQSTFSTVPFDSEILTCGNTGFHSCNGSNVERMDHKIPDLVFDQINSDLTNTDRVCSIRDYYSETVYWSFRNNLALSTATYPNKILLYNYRNQTWALLDEQVTAFGYFEQVVGTPWSGYTSPWYTWTSLWGSGAELPGFRQVIAGNQEGFIFVIARDDPKCAAVTQVSNITYTGSGPYTATITAVDHNLYPGAYIKIEDLTATLPFDFRNVIYEVETVVDSNNFTIVTETDPEYLGNAYYRFIPRINIKSKQWNPYIAQARDVYIAKIDFGVTATTEGAITVDYYASSGDDSTLYNAEATGTLLGTGSLSTVPYDLVTQEINASRLWHPVYLQNEGECIQIELSYSLEQVTDIDIVDSDFVLEGIVLHCTPTTSRLY
jgi:hypothetical protein